MIEIAEITAVSDLKIFSFILIDWTPLNERIFSLSSSEKSPSGPIIIQVGFDVSWSKLIFLFDVLRSVKIKSILWFFKNELSDWTSSIKGTFILFDCSVASIITFSNLSLFILRTIVLSKL